MTDEIRLIAPTGTLGYGFFQGAIGDSDVYGAQQHVPLLDIAIPWGADAPALDQQQG